MCVCVCVKAARQEHQTNFEELEGLIAMGICLHEAVLPAAHAGLFGISPCLEAPTEKDQDEVEEATTEALSVSLLLLVGFAVLCAPAGQSKLRSGGLREGSLTLAFLRMFPRCRPSGETRQWIRRFAMSFALRVFFVLHEEFPS